MDENNETVTETTETTTTPLSRKALILAGTVTGIIIAGGFAFLKKNQHDVELEVFEAVDVEIIEDEDTPDTDQN